MEHLNFIQTYFTEEKIESLFFIVIGSIAIVLAFIFLGIIKYSFFKGMAYPLLFIGLLQVIVGSTVYIQVPKHIERVEQIINKQTILEQSNEVNRMKIVMQNFSTYKWIELILIITGIILFFSFYKSSQTFWKGFGLSLLIQTCIMLSLDIVAEHRATIYIQHLLSL